MLVLAAALAAAPLAAAPPHVVVIVADDLGYSDLGSYGGEIETPHLDRLARGGVRFTQFYTTPRCSPSRAALLTGLHPHEVGVGHLNRDWGRDGYRGELDGGELDGGELDGGDLDGGAETLAETLGRAGYRTYMAGKWHLSPNPGPSPGAEGRRGWPLARGFDHFFGTLRGSGSYFHPPTLARGDTFVEPGEDFYYTDALSAAAADFVARHFAAEAGRPDPGRPLFLYLAYTAPHWPLHARAEDIRRYAGRYDAGWDVLRRERYRRQVAMGLASGGWALSPRDPGAPAWDRVRHRRWQARRMEVYAAMVESMDRGIGRVLAALEAAGALDDSLIFFLSDNGACAEVLGGIYRLGGTFLLPLPPDFERRRFGDQPRLMPGPATTYQAYGRGWSNLSNSPFRGHKHDTHEGGIATPLIVHWPAGLGVAGGSLIDAPGHIVDLVPTVLEATGARRRKAARELRGESLLPLFGGGVRPPGGRQRRPMYWEHEGNAAVRDGRWKLVRRWPWPWELYDLEDDRGELRDLASREPRRVAELRAMYERFAAASRVATWPWVVPQVRWLAWGAAAVLVGLAILALRRRRRTPG